MEITSGVGGVITEKNKDGMEESSLQMLEMEMEKMSPDAMLKSSLIMN